MPTSDPADRPPVTIRVAEPHEYDEIADLLESAYVDAGLEQERSPYLAVLRDVAGHAQPGPVLVAERSGELVGTVTICPYGSRFSELALPGEVEFRFLAVASSAWGTGIADDLVRACEQHGRDVGAAGLAICVLARNAAAHGLYARHGFVRVPERDFEPVPNVLLQTSVKAL